MYRRPRFVRTNMLTMAVALLASLVSGCDPANPVEATSNADTHTAIAAVGQRSLLSETIEIPDAPDTLRGVVEPDPQPAGRLRSPRHDMEPAGIWLNRLRNATSWGDAVRDAANALKAIRMLPEEAQRVFFPLLANTLEDASDLSDLHPRVPKPARTEIVDLLGNRYVEGIYTICFVGFDDYDTLDNIPDTPQGENTFVWDPHWRQDCGDAGQVRVEPSTPYHLHFHLNFEDPTITCVDPDNDWKFGREVDGECEVVPDFADEPRFMGPHEGNEIIRIRAHDPNTGVQIPFDLLSFQNLSSEPVKVRYKNVSGVWYEWGSLGGPTNWGLSAYDAVEVLITNTGTSLDCGIDQEAGAPGGCAMDPTQWYVDEFVVGLD